MPVGGLVDDLIDLTPLILGVLAFIALLLVLRPVRGAINRAKRVEARRKDLAFSAELSDEQNIGEEEPTQKESEAPAKPDDAAHAEEEAERPGEAVDKVADIRSRMLSEYKSGNADAGDREFELLLAAEKDPGERKRDQARRLAFRFIGGIDPEGLSSLEALAVDAEIAPFVHRMVGLCLESTGRPSDAAEAYGRSRDSADDPGERTQAMVYRSEALAQAGDHQAAISELVGALGREQGDSRIQMLLWDGLAKIYKKVDEPEARALALHQAALLAGNDAEKWFQAGYAYSEVDSRFNLVVIHCYLTTLSLEPKHQWAKNNLGVVLGEVNLSIPSRRFYREATDLGNTLAMANLAVLLLNRGFDVEAEAHLEKAAAAKKPDAKVASVTADLVRERDKQSKDLSQIQDGAPQVGEFMAEYGRGRLDEAQSLPNEWKMPGVQNLEVKIAGESAVLVWRVGKYLPHRRFTGSIVGRALQGRFEKEGSPSRLESLNWEDDGPGFGAISADGSAIDLMKMQTPEPVYFKLRSVS